MRAISKMILNILREANRPLRLGEIAASAGMRRGREQVRGALQELEATGEVVKLQRGLFGLAKETRVLVGRLSLHREGYGFVVLEEGGEDIFIPARFLRESMNGDRVAVRVMKSYRGKREGRIVHTVERAVKKLVGTFDIRRKMAVIVPEDDKLRHDVVIPAGAWGDAEQGQLVVAEITSYPSGGGPAIGRIVEVLGSPDDPAVEVMAIVRKYELPHLFSAAAMTEASSVPQQVLSVDLDGRKDLRLMPFVTIDGETARDFDDAIALEPAGGGDVRVWVAIADVAHYVHPGSPLDQDAFARGTSVYFPDRAIPMLPESLSNGICSLNPDVDRLVMTVELVVSPEGVVLEEKFYPAVIRSRARLTYTKVKNIVEPESTAAVKEVTEVIHGALFLMKEVALRLMQKREKRGSIDFDLPEPEVVLDLRGQTEAIVRAERNIAHRMIEELMLAANESVASFLEKRGIPSIYRVHDAPDLEKMRDFQEFIYNFGYNLPVGENGVKAHDLQNLLEAAAGKPEERMINGVLLRSMKQARYSPDNTGHFGLAASCYTHFTSPIRRYPDLLVHRILKEVIGNADSRRLARLTMKLAEVTDHCSKRERVAMDAERDVVELKKIQFMESKVGEEYFGFISGVTSFGFFVELVEYFVEGLVHMRNLSDDYYLHQEKQHSLIGQNTRRVFRVGDRVKVVVQSVSVARREIDFALVEDVDSALRRASAPRSGFHPMHNGRQPMRKKGRRQL